MAAGAGADADVVALQPVVVVVQARPAAAREVAHLVGIEAGLGQARAGVLEHRAVQLLVVGPDATLAAVPFEPRAGLEGEVVAGQVVGPELQRALEVAAPLVERLAGDAEHQVHADVVEARRARRRKRALDGLGVVRAVERLQVVRVEGLSAHAEPTDAALARRLRLVDREALRVGLHRHLGARR